MQTDLELAKQRLSQENFNLVIAKKGRVLFETQAHGINGLLDAINRIGKNIRESSVADRIVGRAAALLLVYSGVVAVFAVTISDSGIEVLRSHGIAHEFEKRVPNILNQEKADVCPFEKLIAEVSDPKDAYEALKICCKPKQAL